MPWIEKKVNDTPVALLETKNTTNRFFIAPNSFNEVTVEEAQPKDIAELLCNCVSREEVQQLWASLSEKEQMKYSKLFNGYSL